MYSNNQSIVPVTCKQLLSAHIEQSAILLGHAPIHTISMVGLLIPPADNSQIFQLDDSTGCYNHIDLQSVDKQSYHITEFGYNEIIISLTSTVEGNIQCYAIAVLPADGERYTLHMLQAYAYHLRHSFSPQPFPTLKQVHKQQQSSAGSLLTSGLASSFHTAYNGVNAAAAATVVSSGFGMPMPQMNGAADPASRIRHVFSAVAASDDGLSLEELVQHTGLTADVVMQQMSSFIESGLAFEASDSTHWSLV